MNMGGEFQFHSRQLFMKRKNYLFLSDWVDDGILDKYLFEVGYLVREWKRFLFLIFAFNDKFNWSGWESGMYWERQMVEVFGSIWSRFLGKWG